MPKIEFEGVTLKVKEGSNLRRSLLRAGLSPHNKAAGLINCHGLGTCGTCAVQIDQLLPEPGTVERWRLNFPPHKLTDGLRLACQVSVNQDMKVTKHPGFWGQKTGPDLEGPLAVSGKSRQK